MKKRSFSQIMTRAGIIFFDDKYRGIASCMVKYKIIIVKYWREKFSFHLSLCLYVCKISSGSGSVKYRPGSETLIQCFGPSHSERLRKTAKIPYFASQRFHYKYFCLIRILRNDIKFSFNVIIEEVYKI